MTRSLTHVYPPTTTATQTNKEMQHATRKPSMFQVYAWRFIALGWFTTGCLGLTHWVFVEFSALRVGIYSSNLILAGLAVGLFLREYRKVIDASIART